MKILVLVERADRNYGGYAPDVPGCVATGSTREETLERMREALRLHLEGMREDGEALPDAFTSAEILEVPAA